MAWLRRFAVGFAAVCLATVLRAEDLERPPIQYTTAPTHNPVSRLQERIDAGHAKLVHEDRLGYLRSLLRELNVPISSQTLVFSKTSLQRERIKPSTPRALYFNDDVSIGCCQNGVVLEIAAIDPQLGPVFYSLDQERTDRPVFTRQGDTCLICHASSMNQGFPGLLARSVFADADGLPLLASGSYRIDHTSPMENRWGGWYVTGTSGKQKHLGNLIVRGRRRPEDMDTSPNRNLTDLGKFFQLDRYPSPHSDIVALLVLEH